MRLNIHRVNWKLALFEIVSALLLTVGLVKVWGWGAALALLGAFGLWAATS
jgi:hypothetical protein